jgi:hypothetical protein
MGAYYTRRCIRVFIRYLVTRDTYIAGKLSKFYSNSVLRQRFDRETYALREGLEITRIPFLEKLKRCLIIRVYNRYRLLDTRWYTAE